ncbi:ABC transporter ATP-binding protein [Paradesulfitobacterium aromaticivorans]
MLEVKNLMLFYENALAVNDLDLEVKPGEIVGVFGSNSAGKTSIFNTIAGLTNHLRSREQRKGGMRITLNGQIRFLGEDISSLKPRQRVERGIVLCRERHPVFRNNTVEENLKLGGYLRKEREIEEGMKLVYEIFPPLTRLKQRKAGMLSGGEKEMVAIGMALIAKPKLLLLDEPLLGLSPHMQQEVVRAAVRIREHGVTILISEQYARPIMPVVDRAYIIENGTMVIGGTSRELMENPEVKSAYFGS